MYPTASDDNVTEPIVCRVVHADGDRKGYEFVIVWEEYSLYRSLLRLLECTPHHHRHQPYHIAPCLADITHHTGQPPPVGSQIVGMIGIGYWVVGRSWEWENKSYSSDMHVIMVMVSM